jgi:HIP---CoA ligase
VKLTIPAAVDRAASLFGAQTAIAEPGGPRLTYADLRDRVAGIAGAFLEQGIEPGERIAIWSPNTYHWVLGALGALYAGATLVPINTRFTGSEALDVVARSGARALLVAGPFLGTDRLAELRKAAAGDDLPGPGLSQLRLIVRIPVEDGAAGLAGPAGMVAMDWPEFELCGAGLSALAAERAAAVEPDQVSDIPATSCLPRARPAGARAP